MQKYAQQYPKYKVYILTNNTKINTEIQDAKKNKKNINKKKKFYIIKNVLFHILSNIFFL